MNHNLTIVAVDGPAGSGKSTVSKMVARKLNWSFVSTGAVYRMAAFIIKSQGLEFSSGNERKWIDAIATSAEKMSWNFDSEIIVFDGQEFDDELQTIEIGEAASLIAKVPEIRHILLSVQRNFCLRTEKKGVIVEGRDVGTIVFPDAKLKIFLTASIEERVARRGKQLQIVAADQEYMREKLEKRDLQDSTRIVAPLIPAADAILIDTSGKSLADAVEEFLSYALKL